MWDAENTFSDRQEVSATAISENTVFVGKGDAGPGEPLTLQVVTTRAEGGGSLNVFVETDDVDTMAGAVTLASYNLTPQDIARGGPVLAAGLPSGCKNFLRLRYEPAGTVTGLTVTAGLTPTAGQTNR